MAFGRFCDWRHFRGEMTEKVFGERAFVAAKGSKAAALVGPRLVKGPGKSAAAAARKVAPPFPRKKVCLFAAEAAAEAGAEDRVWD